MSASLREHLTGHIAVWIAQVSENQESLGYLKRYVDSRDGERLARFKFAEDRARFVLGRALVRKCLGACLDLAAEKVELGVAEGGRPTCPRDPAVQFNVSHSGDLVVLAATIGARVGIDVERVHSLPDLPELAQRIFSTTDQETFLTFRPGEALEAFFRAWTRKEAYLKARSEGIAEGLQQISALFSAEEVSEITDDRSSPPETWRATLLPMPAGYAATVACDDFDREPEFESIRFEQGQLISTPLCVLK